MPKAVQTNLCQFIHLSISYYCEGVEVVDAQICPIFFVWIIFFILFIKAYSTSAEGP